jgi:hypothetical protein
LNSSDKKVGALLMVMSLRIRLIHLAISTHDAAILTGATGDSN